MKMFTILYLLKMIHDKENNKYVIHLKKKNVLVLNVYQECHGKQMHTRNLLPLSASRFPWGPRIHNIKLNVPIIGFLSKLNHLGSISMIWVFHKSCQKSIRKCWVTLYYLNQNNKIGRDFENDRCAAVVYQVTLKVLFNQLSYLKLVIFANFSRLKVFITVQCNSEHSVHAQAYH